MICSKVGTGSGLVRNHGAALLGADFRNMPVHKYEYLQLINNAHDRSSPPYPGPVRPLQKEKEVKSVSEAL